MGRTWRSQMRARQLSVRGRKSMSPWMSGARSVRFTIWTMRAVGS